jgi:hypothetical protein
MTVLARLDPLDRSRSLRDHSLKGLGSVTVLTRVGPPSTAPYFLAAAAVVLAGAAVLDTSTEEGFGS